MTDPPALAAAGNQLRIGTSGWVYRDWRGRFYPQGMAQREWLAHYAARFSTVEVNTTFYRLPPVTMVEGWRARVPEGFAFVAKGSRYLTHMKRLLDVDVGVHRFFERLAPLGPTLAVVLWQLPPTMQLDLGRLDRFLAALPGSVRHAVEFRHPSWQVDEAYALLDRHATINVNVSGPQLPADLVVTGGSAYVRFHGLAPGYSYDYTDDDLRPWAEHLRRVGTGFAFFNNDVGGHAVANATQLEALVASHP